MNARIALVGAGPAGLMAAQGLLDAGLSVDLYEAKPSAGRKFLLAGKGGLNLTHSEPLAAFAARYAQAAPQVAAWLDHLGPQAIRAWADDLGAATFVGSSGRVFPEGMKAAPLLRAWLHRLKRQGLRLHARHRWTGWTGAAQAAADETPPGLCLDTPTGAITVRADAVVLALGGASWPQLGSDGAWVDWLRAQDVGLSPLRPANCGFDVARADGTPGWSEHLVAHHAGAPIKSVRLHFDDGHEPPFERQGEFVLTATGIEGSLVYAVSARLRDAIDRDGQALIHLDLVPGRSLAQLTQALARPRAGQSVAAHLRRQAGLEGVKAALLREAHDSEALAGLLRHPELLAAQLKAWPLRLCAARPVAEAISTAGGVRFDSMDEHLMLRPLPGVFCAGEMIDWEAPTGGYLLTACLASGAVAAQGVLSFLREHGASGSPGRN